MPRLLYIAGDSESGKTRLIERLIPELRSRGWEVGSIKHAACGLHLDRDGKDSWRHLQAGAQATLLHSSDEVAVISQAAAGLSPEELADRYLGEMDLVLAEGYHDRPGIRIELGHPSRPAPSGSQVLAQVREEQIAEQAVSLAGLIEQRLLQREPSVRLRVDGRPVPLNRFVKEMVAELVRGMIRPLRGLPERPSRIQLEIQEGGE